MQKESHTVWNCKTGHWKTEITKILEVRYTDDIDAKDAILIARDNKLFTKEYKSESL